MYELGNLAETEGKALNKKGSPNQRKELFPSYKTIAVLKDEVITVDEWTLEVCTLEQKLALLQNKKLEAKMSRA